MLKKQELTRTLLYHRHRLSDRQINDWLGIGEKRSNSEEMLHQLFKVAQFIQLTDYFTSNGIPFVSFKGPLLSQKIYQDPIYRYFNDLDFLISREDLTKVLSLLKIRGFQTENFELPEDPCRRDLWMDHTNQINLYHPENNLMIEIHWSLFFVEFLSQRKIKELVQANSSSYTFQGRDFKGFSDELELIYLIIHGGSHYWGRLKWLVDIKEFIARIPINDDRFIHLAKEMRALGLVALCNSLLKIYFPDSRLLPDIGKFPCNMLKKALKNIDSETMFEMRTLKEYFRFYWDFSRLVTGQRFKINVLKKMLFASDLASRKWMPCSAPINYLLGPFWKLSRGIRL